MKNAIRKYRTPFLALVFTVVLGLVVGGYILSNQRFFLPSWVPLIGTDFVDYKAEFATAQAVTPGQGQTINIAGVPVGEIGHVDLVGGRAVMNMKIRRRYAHIYKNASALLRPKTGLNDMIIQLDPGTPDAGELDPKTPLPIGQTLPNVNFDEVLSALDTDTRSYLRMLIAAGGRGLGGQGVELGLALKRFAPINRDARRIGELLARRDKQIKRSITNFSLLADAVGSKDRQLTQLIAASKTSLSAFADQDRNLREALRAFPETLSATNTALGKATTLAQTLGPAAGELRTGARALPSTERALRSFFDSSTPVLRDELRPAVRSTTPSVKNYLRPATRDLAAAAPNLTTSFKTLNYVLNELAYDPPGSEEGFGYYLAWVNHIGPSVFATQDANGPVRRGALLMDCFTLRGATAAMPVNPALEAILALANPVPLTKAAAGNPELCKGALNGPPSTIGQ